MEWGTRTVRLDRTQSQRRRHFTLFFPWSSLPAPPPTGVRSQTRPSVEVLRRRTSIATLPDRAPWHRVRSVRPPGVMGGVGTVTPSYPGPDRRKVRAPVVWGETETGTGERLQVRGVIGRGWGWKSDKGPEPKRGSRFRVTDNINCLIESHCRHQETFNRTYCSRTTYH